MRQLVDVSIAASGVGSYGQWGLRDGGYMSVSLSGAKPWKFRENKKEQLSSAD